MHIIAFAVTLTLVALMGLTLFPEAAGAEERASPTRQTMMRALAEEYEASGRALSERWERTAQGDALGVAIADRELQLHRARYRDLKRELDRLSGDFSSAAVTRSPFVPDFMSQREVLKVAAPPPFKTLSAWDLYAHTGPLPSREARWGMYGEPVPQTLAAPAPALPPMHAPPSLPVTPFRVYRAPEAQGTPGQ